MSVSLVKSQLSDFWDNSPLFWRFLSQFLFNTSHQIIIPEASGQTKIRWNSIMKLNPECLKQTFQNKVYIKLSYWNY